MHAPPPSSQPITGQATELQFYPLPAPETVAPHTQPAEQIAILALNRSAAANAFNGAVIAEITAHLEALARLPRGQVRVVVLCGKGKHFSAGADLAWMQRAAQLSYSENVTDAAQLTAMFEALWHLEIPTLAMVAGSAFGGAVGLAACCDVVVAAEDARFCLSEAKLGLLPAVILPYLARKMLPGQLRRLALSGRVFLAEEAVAAGLVQRTAPLAKLAGAVGDEINALLGAAPGAQAAVKKLHDQVIAGALQQGPHTVAAIAAARTSPEGQAGLAAFFAKQLAPWVRALPVDPEHAADWLGS